MGMINPGDRGYAESFNKQNPAYFDTLRKKVIAEFIAAAKVNMATAIEFHTEQLKDLRNHTEHFYPFYNFVDVQYPTSEGGLEDFISTPIISYKIVECIEDDGTSTGEELEISMPVTDDFVLDSNTTIEDEPINTSQIYVKQSHKDANGKLKYTYYFVWPGGVGSYEPVSQTKDEHNIEFSFFIDNINKLSLKRLQTSQILNWHEHLVDFTLWYFKKTDLDLRSYS